MAIFRGGSTTFLREAIGNAVFFSVYEHVRYYMHLKLKAASSDHSNLIDMGIGIVSGGLGGVAVSILTALHFYFFLLCFSFTLILFYLLCFLVLVSCSTFGCCKNHYPDCSR